MQTVFKAVKLATGITVFLLLLGFATKNTDGVSVRYFLGLEWQAPLIIVLLAFFAAGAALGVAASLARLVAQQREILALRRELRGLTRKPAAAPGQVSATPAR